ncbi:hypothetical protein EZS27_026641 [termite gut metagenome]|uniref:Uncharacterized protein n=1 Tax=termite gut metagenome TaxID=433724 RepID=A0A5J4QSN7_9ZZZZ
MSQPRFFHNRFEHRNVFHQFFVVRLVFLQQGGHGVKGIQKIDSRRFRVGGHVTVVVVVENFAFAFDKETVLHQVEAVLYGGFRFHQQGKTVERSDGFYQL